tara:strand:+ start:130 stop:957 length:828 start_codon:yes stop_codon:yes gene_type:complete
MGKNKESQAELFKRFMSFGNQGFELGYKDIQRLEGITKAVEDIKKDRETHNDLLDYCGEAEGFVLKLDSYSYLEKREGDSPEPAFLSVDYGLKGNSRLLLIANRHGDNRVVFGNFGRDNRVRSDNGVEYIVEVSAPDSNMSKMFDIDNESLTKMLLAGRANSKLSYPKGYEPDKRDWSDPISDSSKEGRKKIVGKFLGKDLKFLYGKSIENAREWYDDLMRYSGGHESQGYIFHGYGIGGIVSGSQNICFRNRNLYDDKKIPTKIWEVRNKELCL